MTAAVIAFPESPSNGLTRGQVQYLRQEAVRCRAASEMALQSMVTLAEGLEAVAGKRYVTEADWQYIYANIGSINWSRFDALK